MRSSSKTQFKKGQSGNPSGRPKLNSEQKAIRRFLRDEIFSAISSTLLDDIATSERVVQLKNISGIEYILRKAVVTCDWRVIENCLDRTIGKPRQEDVPQGLSVVSSEELLKQAKEAIRDVENGQLILS